MADDPKDEKDPKDTGGDNAGGSDAGATDPSAGATPADGTPVGEPGAADPKEQPPNQGPDPLEVLNDIATRVYHGEMVEEMSQEFPDVPARVIKAAGSREQAKELALVYRDEMKKVKQEAKAEREKEIGQRPGPMSAEDASARLEKLKGSGNLTDYLALHARQRGVQLERANQTS